MLSHAQLFARPWTVACQTPLCMGILQARILEWVAISYSRGSFRPRDQTCVSCIAGRYFTIGPLGKSLSTLLYFLIFFRIFSPSVWFVKCHLQCVTCPAFSTDGIFMKAEALSHAENTSWLRVASNSINVYWWMQLTTSICCSIASWLYSILAPTSHLSQVTLWIGHISAPRSPRLPRVHHRKKK